MGSGSSKTKDEKDKKEPELLTKKKDAKIEVAKSSQEDKKDLENDKLSSNINKKNAININEKKEPEPPKIDDTQPIKKENDKEEKENYSENLEIRTEEKLSVFMKVLRNKNLMPIILDYLDNEGYRKYNIAVANNNYLSGDKEKKVYILNEFNYGSLPLILRIKNIRKFVIKNYTRYLPLIQTINTNNITGLEVENDSVDCNDFRDFPHLKSLKLKCKNFKGINNLSNIQILNLSDNGLSNLDFDSIRYFKLTELYLNNNNLTGLSSLSRYDFSGLTILNLAHNKISNITFLKDCNFPLLSELYLNENEISDISVLHNCKFLQLTILNLNRNNINECMQNIAKCDFPILTELYLGGNNIVSKDEFPNFNFQKLNVLDLSYNKFDGLNFLISFSFPLLKKLYLSNNRIKDIETLEYCSFKNLIELDLGKNKITNIDVFDRCMFPEIKKLILCDNNINSISVIQRWKFPNLLRLDLKGNKEIKSKNNIKMLNNYKFKYTI